MNIEIYKNYELISQNAALRITRQILKKENTILGLATGSSPEGLYRKLIQYYQLDVLSFEQVKTFNLDEYVGLSASEKASYAYFMHNKLFKHIDIDLKNIHFLNGLASDVDQECKRYDQQITSLGGIDLQVLGIGTNGHIGFNEPNNSFTAESHLVDLKQQTCQDNARFFDSLSQVPTQALSMGLRSIMQAKEILLIAVGESKAPAIKKAVLGKVCTNVPASILQLHPNVTLLLDEKSASQLTISEDYISNNFFP